MPHRIEVPNGFMPKTKKAVIFGTADFAQVALVYLRADSPYEVAAFTVHRQYIEETDLLGLPVVPFEELPDRFPPSEYEIFVAIGFKRVNKLRAEMVELCRQQGYTLLSYINSQAVHFGEIEIGDNTFVFEHNTIQPFVKIGDNTILWSGNHIGHHTKIGNNCFLASHIVISGRVTIGDNCFIGVNATFRDGVTVAAESVIGAGASIMKDTVERGVYKGPKTDPESYTSDQLKNF